MNAQQTTTLPPATSFTSGCACGEDWLYACGACGSIVRVPCGTTRGHITLDDSLSLMEASGWAFEGEKRPTGWRCADCLERTAAAAAQATTAVRMRPAARMAAAVTPVQLRLMAVHP